jgi:hypothetical protein
MGVALIFMSINPPRVPASVMLPETVEASYELPSLEGEQV